MALDAGAGARPGYDGAQGVGGGVGVGGAMPPGADGVVGGGVGPHAEEAARQAFVASMLGRAAAATQGGPGGMTPPGLMPAQNCNVYLAGLPLTLLEQDLLKLGQQFGTVLELKLLTEVAVRKQHRTLSGLLRFSRRTESDLCIRTL